MTTNYSSFSSIRQLGKDCGVKVTRSPTTLVFDADNDWTSYACQIGTGKDSYWFGWCSYLGNIEAAPNQQIRGNRRDVIEWCLDTAANGLAE